METTAIRLRNEIKKRGFSITDFAKLTDIAQPTLSRMLNDSLKISDRYLEKAASVLNVSVNYLLGTEDQGTNNFPPSHNFKNVSREYKIDLIKQVAAQFGYRINEYLDFNPEIPLILPTKKIWLRDGDYFKKNSMVLDGGEPLFAETETEKLSQKQMEEKVKSHSGSVVHEYIITNPQGKQKYYDSETFNQLLLSVSNILDNLFSQLFYDEYIDTLDTLIKYKDVLAEGIDHKEE